MSSTEKFKAGDRFTVNEDDLCGGYRAGDEFEVISFDGGVTFIDNDGDKRYLGVRHISLVPVAEATGTDAQADKPKFKVGDRVRIASGPNNGGFGQIGDTGVIETVGRTNCLVRFETGGRSGEAWYVGFGYLELAEPATLTIHPGKFYRTRDGRKVGPMREAACDERWTDSAGRKSAFIADDYNNNGTGGSYASDGTWLTSDDDYNHLDLIAEWIDEPQQDEPPVAEQQAGESRANDGKIRFTSINPPLPGDVVYLGNGDAAIVSHVTDDGNIVFRDRDATWQLYEEEDRSSCHLVSRDTPATAGFTVPLCALEAEPDLTAIGKAYADGYAAGLAARQAA